MAAWKPKEKELSIEDTLYLAKRELAPFWLYSNPLFAGFKGENSSNAQIFPIEPEFSKKDWIIYIFDPLAASGELLVKYLDVYNKRFEPLDLVPLLVISPAYSSLKSKAAVEPLLKKMGLTLPTVIDYDGSISKAFLSSSKAKDLPMVGFIRRGVLQYSQSGQNWFEGFEVKLHHILRLKDPGLPLWQPWQYKGAILIESGRIDFGIEKEAKYPSPGFVINSVGIGSATFPEGALAKYGSTSFSLKGNWIQDQDAIATNDTKATLTFSCRQSNFSIVGRVANRKTDPGKVYIELGGVPIFERFAGSDVSFDDEGKSFIRLDEFKPYQVIKGLDATDGAQEITLSFPLATHAQVVINGVRFSQLQELE